MSGFHPGPGWREVRPGTPDQYRNVGALVEYGADGKRNHVWVREEPMPPLPTEPGYYVDANGSAWHLDDDGEWDDTFGNPVPDTDSPKRPLARYEPRAVTAKAVLERVHDMTNSVTTHLAISAIGRDFGVPE